MKCRHRKVCIWLACLVLLAALLPTAALARESIDTTKTDCALSIQYPCSGISFRLYRVADISPSGTLSLTGGFEKYNVSFVDLDSTGWRDLAATLDGYIRRDNLTPVDSKVTDSSGKLTFSECATGLYLVTWDRHTTGGYTYTPQPFLVSLPGLDADDSWSYTVDAAPKYDRDKVPDGSPDEPDTVNRKVLKVWKDGGSDDARPGSVTVQLLRDGKVYQEVTLSAANNWSHIWNDLDAGHTWQVVEKDVPDGYTVSVGRSGITFTVTNTLTPPPTPDEPDDPDTPNVPDTPDTPDEPDEPDTPDTPDDPDEPDIPQTGQLWWPVPLLACGGMGLFLTGWQKRRNHHQGETDDES